MEPRASRLSYPRQNSQPGLENLKDAVQLYLDTVMEEEIARQTARTLDEA